MNKINNFLKSENGSIIVSIIWGLGLAALFRRVCNGRDCIIVKGPPPSRIKQHVYKYDNKCYRYLPYPAKCNKDEKKNIKV